MADRYKIEGRLGRGGIGAVYKAYDNHLKRDVAIKRLLPIEETRLNEASEGSLEQEAKALASLSHPNIVTIYEFSEDDEGPYVVVELIEGDTIAKVIESGALSENDFYEVADQILDALVAAHAMDILHRDIKPANIMLSWLPSEKFQIKMLDFGLAKFSEKPSTQTLDQKGSFLGSIDYIAPEQIDLRPLDQRTDLYSLGCVLYFSLTQFAPYKGKNMAETMTNHVKGICTPLEEMRPDIPIAVTRWVMSLIATDPDQRPSTALEALEGLTTARETANEAITDSIPKTKLAVPVVTTVHPAMEQESLQDTKQIVTTPSPITASVSPHPNATSSQPGTQKYTPSSPTSSLTKPVLFLVGSIFALVLVVSYMIIEHNKGGERKTNETVSVKTPPKDPVTGVHPAGSVDLPGGSKLVYENSGSVISLPNLPLVDSLVSYYSCENPVKRPDGSSSFGDESNDVLIGLLENKAPGVHKEHLLRSPTPNRLTPRISRSSKGNKTIVFNPRQKLNAFQKGLLARKISSTHYTFVIMCKVQNGAEGAFLRIGFRELNGKAYPAVGKLGYKGSSFWLESEIAKSDDKRKLLNRKNPTYYHLLFVEMDGSQSKLTCWDKTKSSDLSDPLSINLTTSGKMQLSWYEIGNFVPPKTRGKRIEIPFLCIYKCLLTEEEKQACSDALFSKLN